MSVSKRILTILLLLLIFPSVCLAGDFRKASWGMSKEEILKIEKSKPKFHDKQSLQFTGTLNNLPCSIIYKFKDGQLVQGIYSLNSNYINKNKHIDDFQETKTFLSKKYGKPIKDRQDWLKDLYKESPHLWGTALALEQLVFFAQWETDTTMINMRLYGEKFEITNEILYQDKASMGQLEEYQ